MCAQTYKKAGVDIDKAGVFLAKIKPFLEKTRRPENLWRTGGFSGLFMPRLGGLKDPVLVSSTDGVGTKLLLADLLNKHDTVGIDLVAMCVNDIVVTGAEPLFFLDYIACGKLDNNKLIHIVKGISKGCREAGCDLIGGETAELPGLYAGSKLDLAGFCVGMVSREKLIDGSLCRKGDSIIGLASNGPHSNGFSLIRKIFDKNELNGPLGRNLLRPTRIYVRTVLGLGKKVRIKGMAHITGGGFYDNIPRVLPPGLTARVRRGAWPVPRIFRVIQDNGAVPEKEMFRTFNMGIGMAAIVSRGNADRALSLLKKMGQKAWVIGDLAPGPKKVDLV